MENKHEMTEKLKVIETQIYNDKIDMKAINSKLENGYKYEDDLLDRLNYARKQNEELRNELFKRSSEISQKYDKMKEIFDVFTANFYKH